MSRKKKGFTLVEIIVVIAISTIVLTMVGGSMIFITSTSANLMQQAEDIDMAKNIETYLRGLADTTNVKLDSDGNLIDDNGIIFSDTGLKDNGFEIKDGKCNLTFKSEKHFEFTLWIQETKQGE